MVTSALHRRMSTLLSIKNIIVRSGVAWIDHDAPTMGAALAFYTMFSIAPILIIAISVVGLVIGADTVRSDLLAQMQSLLGETGASAVQTLLTNATYVGKSHLATVVGVVTLVIGASTVFVELQNSLDRIWALPKREKTSGLRRVLRSRFLSLGLVVGVGFLLLVSLMVSTVLAALSTWLGSFFGEWRGLLFVVDMAVSLSISAVLFALVYKYVPRERIAWSDVWVGGWATAVLFNIGKFAIGFYLGKSAFASVYGAAGSFLVLLLWVYYSAQIFLFGAELTRSFSYVLGSRVSLQPGIGPSDSDARQRVDIA